jgi:TRAP-type C4-dicarboxylate transport system substrate-binding protein
MKKGIEEHRAGMVRRRPLSRRDFLKLSGAGIAGMTALGAAGCGSSGESGGGEGGAQTLRLISFVPTNDVITRDIVPMWIDKVEGGTNGEVEIEWIGGPESIPQADQFGAVRDGLVDVNMNVAAYYTNEVPGILSVHLSPHTPSEERENGYFDYLAQRHEEAGVVYLGRWLSGIPFYFWSNEKVDTLEDFDGKTIRSNPSYHPVLLALGVNPVDVTQADVYTSLERDVVQGFGWPILGPQEYGWTEVTDYIINEPLMAQSGTITMNSEALQSLSPENQEKIRDLTAEFETEMRAHFMEKAQRESEALREAGVEAVELSPEDSERFQELWKDAHWQNLEESAPEEVDELRSLLQEEADEESDWTVSRF